MRVSSPAVAILLLLSGCVLPPLGNDACPEPIGWFLTGPFDEDGRASMFLGPTYRILFFGRSTAADNADLTMRIKEPAFSTKDPVVKYFNASAEEGLSPNGTVMGGATPSFFAEQDFGEGNYTLALSQDSTQCDPPGELSVSQAFTHVSPGESARPGVGVMVKTAGFWQNGTLFYTNMARVHDDPKFERAGWYEYEGDDPLPVYIYNETRTERPERYNASGFVTTIPGFNEALKKTFVGTSAVASLSPTEAYTRPGNENHDLYGDAIVFYIEITDVVAIDCPLPEPACEPPTVPPASHGEEERARRPESPIEPVEARPLA